MSGAAAPTRRAWSRYGTSPRGAAASPVLGLVGKGITFDTGGISIKPAADMDRMKDDMAGGAAVACAMRAIAELKAPIRVIGVIPIAENMPGGRAIRPGDVLKSASGKTVEVINTDAEGRLILGDALVVREADGRDASRRHRDTDGSDQRRTRKNHQRPVRHACRPSSSTFAQIAERAGDRCWPLPLFDEYKDQLRSEIADMINTGGRLGGAITAALFLKEFTGGLPWIHSTSPARRGRRRTSRSCRRARQAWVYGRW